MLIMGWGISHVSMGKSQGLLCPCSCLGLGWIQSQWEVNLVPPHWADCRMSGADLGAWSLAGSGRMRDISSKTCSWAVRWALKNLGLTHWVFPAVQFWWESPGPVNKLIKKQLFTPALGDTRNNVLQSWPKVCLQTHQQMPSLVYKSWVAVQTGGWQKFYHSVTSVFTDRYIKTKQF